MRRLTPLKRIRQCRIALIRDRRRKRRIARKAESHKIKGGDLPEEKPQQPVHNISVYRRGRIRHSVARAKKEMPANFCLVENHDTVATFLAELRHSLFVNGERLKRLKISGAMRRAMARRRTEYDSYIEFASMDRITPAAALVVASEYDRVNTLFHSGRGLGAINIERWKPAVLATLQDVGFLSLLGVDPPRQYLAARDGIYTVPFMSGTKVDGAEIDRLIRRIAAFAEGKGVLESETLLGNSRVYDGLGEAIQNVEDHAYPTGPSFPPPVLKRWWMTGAVEPEKKRFNLVIYDHGISIPVSLPRWSFYNDFRASFFNALGTEFNADDPEKDGETIAQAVQLGRSSTGKPWHGKGLPLMREIVENAAGGSLRIFSRCGEYVYRLGQDPTSRSFSVPLAGTLVEWDLYL